MPADRQQPADQGVDVQRALGLIAVRLKSPSEDVTAGSNALARIDMLSVAVPAAPWHRHRTKRCAYAGG